VTWSVILSRQAVKDAKQLKKAGLRPQAESLLNVLATDPFVSYPRYEKLVGNLNGFYSRRITIQHRLCTRLMNSEKWCMCYACGHTMNNTYMASRTLVECACEEAKV